MKLLQFSRFIARYWGLILLAFVVGYLVNLFTEARAASLLITGINLFELRCSILLGCAMMFVLGAFTRQIFFLGGKLKPEEKGILALFIFFFSPLVIFLAACLLFWAWIAAGILYLLSLVVWEVWLFPVAILAGIGSQPDLKRLYQAIKQRRRTSTS